MHRSKCSIHVFNPLPRVSNIGCNRFYILSFSLLERYVLVSVEIVVFFNPRHRCSRALRASAPHGQILEGERRRLVKAALGGNSAQQFLRPRRFSFQAGRMGRGGSGVGNPSPFRRSARGDLSVGVPHDSHQLELAGEFPSLYHRRISSPNSSAIQQFVSSATRVPCARNSTSAASGKKKGRLGRPLA